MARPPVITEEQILDAARATFLEKGFGATTAEVARRAGIAEGSIFKRYPTKHRLFSCAMMGKGGEPPWLATMEARIGKGDVRKNLRDAALEILEFFRAILPIMMMSWSNPGPDGLPDTLAQPNPPPLRAIRGVTKFFEAEMHNKRLRRHDPGMVARAFLGGIQSYVFFEMLLRAHQTETPLSAAKHVHGLVELLWGGLSPLPSTRKKKEPRS